MIDLMHACLTNKTCQKGLKIILRHFVFRQEGHGRVFVENDVNFRLKFPLHLRVVKQDVEEGIQRR